MVNDSMCMIFSVLLETLAKTVPVYSQKASLKTPIDGSSRHYKLASGWGYLHTLIGTIFSNSAEGQ